MCEIGHGDVMGPHCPPTVISDVTCMTCFIDSHIIGNIFHVTPVTDCLLRLFQLTKMSWGNRGL